MSLYTISIDDSKLKEQINGVLNNILTNELCNRYSSSGREISQAVKDLVYSHKDEIIEKCVSRATTELVKRGLPKLLERYGGENE